MRGNDAVAGSLFSYVDLEKRFGLTNHGRIEEAFGRAKTVAGLSKARHRGLPKIDWQFTFAMAAYNLVRLPKLFAAA